MALSLPSVSGTTTCFATCVLLYEIFSTPIYFILYRLAAVYRPTLLICGILSVVSLISGVFGVCRSTPALVGSLMAAIASAFGSALLGGLCIIFSLDVGPAVTSYLDESLEETSSDHHDKLVHNAKVFLAVTAGLQLACAVFHALLARHLYYLLGDKRGASAFLQTFSLTVFPFSLFLIVGGQYIVDTGTLASAPYTGITIFVGGVLLLAIALLSFLGSNLEYRRLLSICSFLSFLIGTLFVGLSVAYYVVSNQIEDNIITNWDSIRIILPPTFKSKYDLTQFVDMIQTNLKMVAYVGIISGLFLLMEASICITLMTQMSSIKRQAATDRETVKQMRIEASLAPTECESPGKPRIGDAAVVRRYQWNTMFEKSTRRQRICMRLAVFIFVVALALIFSVMCANVVFATKCNSIGKLLSTSNFTLLELQDELSATTLHVTNSFTRGEITVRATADSAGQVVMQQYGSGKRMSDKAYSKSVTGSTVNLDVSALEVTRFLWLDGSCQRVSMALQLPQDHPRTLLIDTNASVDVSSTDAPMNLAGLRVSTAQSGVDCMGLSIAGDGLRLESTSGNINATQIQVNGAGQFEEDVQAQLSSALGSVIVDNSSFTDCTLVAQSGASKLSLSNIYSTASRGRSRISASSVSGSLSVQNVQANWIELKSHKGLVKGTSIVVSGTDMFLGRLEATSVSGDISLSQVTGSGNIHVETSSGDVTSLSFVGLYYLRSEHGKITIRQGRYASDSVVPLNVTTDDNEQQGTINCADGGNCLSYGDLHIRTQLGDIEVEAPLPIWLNERIRTESSASRTTTMRWLVATVISVCAVACHYSPVVAELPEHAIEKRAPSQELIDQLGANVKAMQVVQVQPISHEQMRSVRVLCWVNTYHKNHAKRLLAIKRTWGKKCDKLLFMSDVEDLRVPTVRIAAPPLHETLWQKHREIVRVLLREFREGDFDWVFKSDDDTFLIMENLKKYLLSAEVQELNKKGPTLLGHRMTLQWWELERSFHPFEEHDPDEVAEMLKVKEETRSHGGLYYTPGGGGYAMNWAYLKQLAASFDEPYCLPTVVVPDDWVISFCMRQHGVFPHDTRDSQQRERFHQYDPKDLYFQPHDENDFNHEVYDSIYEENNWFSDHYGIGWKNGDDCCAPDSISFHYVKPPLMDLFYEYYYPQDTEINAHVTIVSERHERRNEDATATSSACRSEVVLLRIWRIVLAQRPFMLCASDLRHLLTVSRAHTSLVQDLVSKVFCDVSRGAEQRPVAVRIQRTMANAPVGMIVRLLEFVYVTSVSIPVPRAKHALPTEVAERVKRDALVQAVIRGRSHDVYVALHPMKGWCVHAAEPIAAGAFIGEYTGHLVSSSRMQQRFDQRRGKGIPNYVLVLREHYQDQSMSSRPDAVNVGAVRTIVDATDAGNFTRFINHSCEPTLDIEAVRVDSYVPKLVFITSKSISAHEELTFDYGSTDTQSMAPSVTTNVRPSTIEAMSSTTPVGWRRMTTKMTKTYDEVCQEATSAAESRLLEHLNLYGGEVWTIGTGCQGCRTKRDDLSGLKKCSACDTALFCDRDCQRKAWAAHKSECAVISTFRKVADNASPEVEELLQALDCQAEAKAADDEVAIGVAKSLNMDSTQLPGWFFTRNFAQESKESQKALKQAALTLYAILRDESCWNRDKESFPRSSYTHIESLPKVHATQAEALAAVVKQNAHLTLFSIWLQHPEPPATQSMPLEDRTFYGVVDSLLQIEAIRDAIDAFMDSRTTQ
ncbi:TPA: LOW QUALITY PROTEIN: hypothetical protein N0F65_003883 [Lagenidium giganteum]|uniref:N-acetylgalactosaminide beta-1,3-galactosyltransferase n=1 Tax=Lagenidium giganteum TaxID=4803 RepID=A0AAV2Z6Z3_9STRA|nr:TPA: LOW QUALITY PROTEIN: hypothetical protein N0F65_003883 [Lagenidium giganteum]